MAPAVARADIHIENCLYVTFLPSRPTTSQQVAVLLFILVRRRLPYLNTTIQCPAGFIVLFYLLALLFSGLSSRFFASVGRCSVAIIV